jgi:hypothetical protein
MQISKHIEKTMLKVENVKGEFEEGLDTLEKNLRKNIDEFRDSLDIVLNTLDTKVDIRL